MRKETTITSKGQVTIPADIREKLNLKPRDKVYFEVKGEEVILRPVRREDLLAVYNSVSAEEKETEVHTIREETKRDMGENAANEGT